MKKCMAVGFLVGAVLGWSVIHPALFPDNDAQSAPLPVVSSAIAQDVVGAVPDKLVAAGNLRKGITQLVVALQVCEQYSEDWIDSEYHAAGTDPATADDISGIRDLDIDKVNAASALIETFDELFPRPVRKVMNAFKDKQ